MQESIRAFICIVWRFRMISEEKVKRAIKGDKEAPKI